MRGRGNGSSWREDSSSGEDDGDANWKAAIDSVATGGCGPFSANSDPGYNGSPAAALFAWSSRTGRDREIKEKGAELKYYQIKAKKVLDEILEKRVVLVKDPINVKDCGRHLDGGVGVRLFKRSPMGIVFDYEEVQRPRSRPRILPGNEIKEGSEEFRREIGSVCVDGAHIMNFARNACRKSLARLNAREAAAAAAAAATMEGERIAELKRLRGERWLPSSVDWK